ncbi:MAG: phosphatidylglycerophosphatase A [Phycisphaerales bacterium]|jgi:phosphatidylglycerophosphatase A|nr:phosphatidylglycerophosphatase A [Phycisphaerales bacterium]
MNTMNRSTESFLTTHGLGHMHPASGTWGSLPTVALAGVLITAGFGPGNPNAWVYYLALSLTLIVYSGACILKGHEAEAKWGKDPSEVVADETAGQAITLMMIPFGCAVCPLTTIGTLSLGFVLFRLFDIFKPWPAGAMQRVAGGWGILLDDLIAGLMAGILLMVLLSVF